MKTNESVVDRIIRLILGIILGYIGYLNLQSSAVIAYILLIIGVVLVITSITGFCLLYKILGISTKSSQ